LLFFDSFYNILGYVGRKTPRSFVGDD